jgi:multidrug efflux system membrane fusion protein
VKSFPSLSVSHHHYGWAGICLVWVAAFLIGGCERGGGQQPAMMPRPPAAVTVAAAQTADVPVYLEEIGKTIPVESVSILPQVGGKLVATHVNDGDWVKKGQLLFEIDPRPFAASLLSAQAMLSQAKADLELATAEFQRVERAGKGAVSQLEYDQKKGALAVAQAKIESANAAIETAKLNLDYTKIFSPLAGRAGARLVDAGNVIKEMDKSMLVIQRLDPIYAEFTVPENDLGTVRKYLAASGIDLGQSPEKGLKVEVDVPGNSAAVLTALGAPAPTSQPTTRHAGPREGTLTFMDNMVQNGTGTIRLRATVPNGDSYFWPGQFVNVRVVLTTKKDAVLVPMEAQQVGQQGPFVYVVGADGKAEIRPFTPGQRQGDKVVAEKGISPGERVVVTGQMQIMPGGPVRVLNEGPEKAPAGPTASAAH